MANKRSSKEAKENREERKSKASVISFFICLGISIFFMVGSAIVPPPFVIDESIFKAVGWLFGFAALGQLPAILNTDKWAKISHGQTTVLVGDKDDMDRKRRGIFRREPPFEEVNETEEYVTDDTEEDDNLSL